METSFEEKSAWLQLLAVGTILGAYFVVAGMMLARGVSALPAYVPLFVLAVVLLVGVLVAGHVALVVVERGAPRDERDRVIGWRAESNSSWLLGVGVLMGIGALVVGIRTVWVAHLLLLSLFLAELLRFALQLRYYRRGL